MLNFFNFNSHAHVERDLLKKLKIIAVQDFNSHAHVERDTVVLQLVQITKISTHTLTWSVTKTASGNAVSQTDFNSHAHVERDTYLSENDKNDQVISTHTLTWSVTNI